MNPSLQKTSIPAVDTLLPLAMGIPDTDTLPGVIYLGLTLLLCFSAFTALALFPVLACRHYPFHRPFFSGLLFLTLCPVLSTFALALVRHAYQFYLAAPSLSDVIETLRPASAMLLFGLLSTVVALSTYTFLYTLSCRTRPA